MATILTHDDTRADTRRRGRSTPRQLILFGRNANEAADAAGGLIFDRATSGWEVRVYLASCPDDRALRVLGAEGQALAKAFTSGLFSFQADVVVADLRLVRDDERVRQRIVISAQRKETDILLWGGDRPGDGLGWVEYRLSMAARAFKQHAVRAGSDITVVERFQAGLPQLDDTAALGPI